MRTAVDVYRVGERGHARLELLTTHCALHLAQLGVVVAAGRQSGERGARRAPHIFATTLRSLLQKGHVNVFSSFGATFFGGGLLLFRLPPIA